MPRHYNITASQEAYPLNIYVYYALVKLATHILSAALG